MTTHQLFVVISLWFSKNVTNVCFQRKKYCPLWCWLVLLFILLLLQCSTLTIDSECNIYIPFKENCQYLYSTPFIQDVLSPIIHKILKLKKSCKPPASLPQLVQPCREGGLGKPQGRFSIVKEGLILWWEPKRSFRTIWCKQWRRIDVENGEEKHNQIAHFILLSGW